MVSQIYPTENQLNKTIYFYAETPFWICKNEYSNKTKNTTVLRGSMSIPSLDKPLRTIPPIG